MGIKDHQAFAVLLDVFQGSQRDLKIRDGYEHISVHFLEAFDVFGDYGFHTCGLPFEAVVLVDELQFDDRSPVVFARYVISIDVGIGPEEIDDVRIVHFVYVRDRVYGPIFTEQLGQGYDGMGNTAVFTNGFLVVSDDGIPRNWTKDGNFCHNIFSDLSGAKAVLLGADCKINPLLKRGSNL